MQTCDVCSEKISFTNKFRYAQGYICKTCYKKASRCFTQTIAQMELSDILEACGEIGTSIQEDNFEITGRIGNYILFDEKNMKICIANNRMTQQLIKNPEFYSVKEIISCKIVSEPVHSLNQLEEMVMKKEDVVLHSLKVKLRFKNKQEKEIILMNTSFRVKSYAFRKTLNFAKRIDHKIKALMNDDVTVSDYDDI